MRAFSICCFAMAMLACTALGARPLRALGPEVSDGKLANGARLLVSEQRNLPMVSVQVLLNAGARHDPPGLPGLANLTADLLTEGTRTRSAAEINEAVDFIGASLSADTGMDSTQVSLRVLKKDLRFGIEVLADVLLHPAFAPEELERNREAVLASIRAAEDDPTHVAAKRFQEVAFAGEPYGHPIAGTKESVPRIRREDVLSFYKQTYGPSGTIIVVVGDVSRPEVAQLLDRHLGSWRATPAPSAAYPAGGLGEPQAIRIDKPVSQAAVILGHRGVPRRHPDYEALQVMNYILGGGGFSSRLMDSIRTQAGLAYSVGSYFAANKDAGSFQVVLQTKNASVNDAAARVRSEVERIRTGAVRPEELEEAKRYLTGSFPLRIDTHREIAQFIAEMAFYDLGLDYAARYIRAVETVSAEDVLRVAREHLHPDRFLEVVVADLDAVGEAASTNPNP